MDIAITISAGVALMLVVATIVLLVIAVKEAKQLRSEFN